MAEQRADKFPRGIDDPSQLLLWSADEIIPIFIFIAIGILIEHFFIMLLVGLVVWKLISKYKDLRPDGYMLHMIYWTSFFFTKSRLFINPFSRHWRG